MWMYKGILYLRPDLDGTLQEDEKTYSQIRLT